MKEESIFTAALHKQDESERAAYLDEACVGDPSLRLRVEALLRSHAEAGPFLARPPVARASSLSFREREGVELGETIGSRIGRYQLLQPIGEGGMGVVWIAEQLEPVRRLVALKVIKPGMDSRKVIARMEAERQALALMDHTGIAKVLDGGATAAGRPYFVMELVQGLPITRYGEEARLSLRGRLELFGAVCHAVQHAHQKGIIHRDIKPSNVLVSVEDGKAIPKVIDFGVAKALHESLTDQSMHTEIGQMVGTLEYMSPEQALSSGQDIDTRTDVYALGVLLYELLTGSTPLSKQRLRNAAYPEVLRLIREEEPVTPSTRLSQSKEPVPQSEPGRLGKELRGDLDWIVMKCLEKDRARRYETADAVARDIERYLNDEPVEARPPSRRYRLQKFLRKHAVGVWTAAACLGLLLGGIVVSTTQAIRATRAEGLVREEAEKVKAERDRAREAEKAADHQQKVAEAARAQEATQRELAEKQEKLARRRLYASQVNLAHQAFQNGHTARTLELLEGVRPRFDEEDLRTFEWYYLWRLCHQGRLSSWRAGRKQITSLTFSPDGKTLATGGWDGVKLWNGATGEPSDAPRIGHDLDNIWTLAFSPDGNTLVTGSTSTDPTCIQQWDLATGRERTNLVGNLPAVRAVAYAPDGKTLVGGGGLNAKLWDTDTGRELQTILPQGTARAVAFSPKGNALALGCDPGVVRVFTAEDSVWREQFVLKGHTDLIQALTFSPDGKQLASAAREVKLWDVASGKELTTFQDGKGIIADVKFTPDGLTLVTAGDDRYVRLWDLATRQERARLAHVAPVAKLAFSRDGALLASATYDGLVQLWDLSGAAEPVSFRHGGAVRAIHLARDGKTLISAGGGPTKLWDLAAGREHPTVPLPGGFLAISPDEKTLASSGNQSAKLWDAKTGRELATLGSPPDSGGNRLQLSRLAFSPDGKLLAAWNPEGGHGHYLVHLWDVDARKLRATLSPYGKFDVHKATSVAFAPDGKTVAVGFWQWWVVLYDTATGQVKYSFMQERDGIGVISALAYSSNGKVLATGTEKGSVRLWDPAGPQTLALRGHTDAVRAIAFAPDGKTIATASDDRTVRLWDALTGQERIALTGHQGPVNAIAFTRDGRLLVSGSADGTVRLWRAAGARDAAAPRSDLDADDPNSAAGLNRAGQHLEQAGRVPEAEQAYRKAITRFEKLAATFAKNPEYRQSQAVSQWNLAGLWQTQGRHREAAGLLADTLAMQRKLGPDDIWVAQTLALLGKNLIQQKKYAEAEPHLRKSLRIRTEQRPETYGGYYTQFLLGRCLLGQENYEEAESLLLAGYAGLQERNRVMPTVSEAHLAEARQRIVELYEASGRPERAAEWRKTKAAEKPR